MKKNPLRLTDVYKLGHMSQYAPGTTKVYSYLIARSDKVFNKTIFIGLTYQIKEYLGMKLTPEMGEDLLKYRERILGPNPIDVVDKIRSLCKLGYWPLEIKAVREGTIMPVRNILMSITNTHPDFYWCVGYIESLILKLWYSITVASCSYSYKEVVDKYFNETVDEDMFFLKQFTVHDFGYRGDATEEGAGISGMCHLLSFCGGDNIPALPFIDEYYHGEKNTGDPFMLSVPASEHSVMCSYGEKDELAAFRQMLKLYPRDLVSIVSDTYNVYTVLTDFAEILKDEILARDGKVVFRPDSGNPEFIICGDPNAEVGSNEWKGAIRLLDEKFGSTLNSKGFKVLNPKVGLIYGDGMYLERYIRTLDRLKEMGYASSNLVIGVGGILRNHSRDTLGFAIKATYVEVNGEQREIMKDPVTDRKKKSHKGLIRLEKISGSHGSSYYTKDQVSWEEEKGGLLETYFKNGELLIDEDFATIKARVQQY